MEIYIFRNSEQFGPLSEAQVLSGVRSGMYAAEDNCWHEGMAEWQPIGTVFSIRSDNTTATVNPAPQENGAVSQIPEESEATSTKIESQPKKSSYSRRLIYAITLAAALILAGVIYSRKRFHAGPQGAMTQKGFSQSELSSTGPDAETDFDSIFNIVFVPHNNLPGDIQGFRFGSSMKDVCANYTKQYGQALNPISTDSAEFVLLRATFVGPKTGWNGEQKERWYMEFGFSQGKLVWIDKLYWNSNDPEKTANILKDYFHLDGSENKDSLGYNGLVVSGDYIGYVSDIYGNGHYPEFSLYDSKFLKAVMRSHLLSHFREFYASVHATDFSAPPHNYINGVGFHLVFGGFDHFLWVESPGSEITEFLRSTKQSGPDSDPWPFDSMPRAGTWWKLSENVILYMAQTLFPSKSGKMLVSKNGNSTVCSWNCKDNFFAAFETSKCIICVGRDKDTPEPQHGL